MIFALVKFDESNRVGSWNLTRAKKQVRPKRRKRLSKVSGESCSFSNTSMRFAAIVNLAAMRMRSAHKTCRQNSLALTSEGTRTWGTQSLYFLMQLNDTLMLTRFS